MSIFVCGLLFLTMLFSLLTNRDVLSPGKFYLVSFVLFYVGALASPDNYELWLLILLVLLIGVATVCLEANARPAPAVHHVSPVRAGTAKERNVAFWIWLASLPAIAAQIYIVQMFNGIEGYINVIGNRVIELRGLGWAKSLIATVVVLNLIYFAVGLTRRRSWLWWGLFVMHVIVVLVMGGLSGSRGAILTVFAAQVFVYHYLRRPVKVLYALPFAVALVAIAMVIGVARQGVKFQDSNLATGLDSYDRVLTLSVFNYGAQPLQILLAAEDLQLANGSTLLSVLTNAVPRDWWPEKPDTGGVFFTKKYTGDAWDGASNLTPTFLGEGVINFGWIGGLVFFLVMNLVVMYFVVGYYRKILRQSRAPPDADIAIDVVIYVLVMWSAIALMAGEVTNTVQNLLLTQFLPAIVLKTILKKRNGPGAVP
jgi:oligosaccharide repeat unit polymerase